VELSMSETVAAGTDLVIQTDAGLMYVKVTASEAGIVAIVTGGAVPGL
jgi:hypothetical protein